MGGKLVRKGRRGQHVRKGREGSWQGRAVREEGVGGEGMKIHKCTLLHFEPFLEDSVADYQGPLLREITCTP